MVVNQPTRGTKRSADTVSQDDEEGGNEDGDGNGDPTPRKKVPSAKRATFNVVVTSPERTRPKQRLRMDVDDEVEVEAVAEGGDVEETLVMDVAPVAAPAELWVATGDVSQFIQHLYVCSSCATKARCKECVDGEQAKCVPQWGAKKPSKACKYCARRRKACNAPKEFLEHVAQLRPDQVGSRKGMYLIRPV
jgi:hypothetical protein